MQKKTILIISPFLPFPLNNGGAHAILNGIQAIINDYNVLFTYPKQYDDDCIEEEKKFVQSLNNMVKLLPFALLKKTPPIHLKLKTRIHKKLDSFYFRRISPPYVVELPKYKTWNKEIVPQDHNYSEYILKIIDEYNVDIVQCEMTPMASCVYFLPSNVKKIFVHHEIRFVCHELEDSITDGPEIDKKSYLKNAMATEVGTLNLFDAIITLSDKDAVKLRNAHVNSNIYSSIAIINKSYKTPTTTFNPLKLTFIGPEFHTPNAIGIKWFLNNCWEKLCENNNYHLSIIGDWTEKTQAELSIHYPNVFFSGYVDNLYEKIKDSILIVPITIGSGIRMKILEATSMGVPVVTTTVGVEGLPFTNMNQCMIGDTPEKFINAIKKFKDDTLRLNIVNNAQKTIQEKYSIESLRNNRLNIYNKIMNDSQ